MADLGNTAVISPTDASNGSGTMPSWLGSAAPSTLDDAGRALQGAVAREWENRSFAITSTGSANAYVVSYTVAPAALRSGQVYSFITNFAVTGSATVNINALGAKTIKKDVAGVLTALSSGDMASGQFVMLAYNGTDMIWVNWQGPSTAVPSLASTTEVLTGTDAAKTTTPDAIAALWEAGTDITDGAAITIGEGGYFNLITSTTAITSFSITTNKAGRSFRVRFDTARTLTHNATSLILPGGANITTAQGDIAFVRSLGGGNVVVEQYSKASGVATVVAASDSITLITTLTTTSGTTQSVTSGILTTYRELYIEFESVSFTAGATLMLAVSGNAGTNYGTAQAVSGGTGAAAGELFGSIRISNIRSLLQFSPTGYFSSQRENSTSTGGFVGFPKHATGGTSAVDAIQFSGGTFDAGTIRVYGVR